MSNMHTSYMSVYIHMSMYIFCKNGVIYNKITSIVNVIRLKLFTHLAISIVYKYATILAIYMYILIGKGMVILRVYTYLIVI